MHWLDSEGRDGWFYFSKGCRHNLTSLDNASQHHRLSLHHLSWLLNIFNDKLSSQISRCPCECMDYCIPGHYHAMHAIQRGIQVARMFYSLDKDTHSNVKIEFPLANVLYWRLRLPFR